ncbi:branched-chain amino acid transport system II carrier protein [Enterobacter cancerogenus]|uniref:branched-chain amino acid transport system II carrier protein n=1 Tax=Enterobacter cancerogenus TaxID=69218 RepID=UPI0030764D37
MRKKIFPTDDVKVPGFMTLALFPGAGNIICPLIGGKTIGEFSLISSLGFIISCALLPLLASRFNFIPGMFFVSPRTAGLQVVVASL